MVDAPSATVLRVAHGIGPRKPPEAYPDLRAPPPDFIPPDAVAQERGRLLRFGTVRQITNSARLFAVAIAAGVGDVTLSEALDPLMTHWCRVTRRDPESAQWWKARAALEGIMEAQLEASEALDEW